MDLAQLTDAVEAVSRTYARRYGITRDDTWFLLKLQEEVGELTQAFLMRRGQARDKGKSAAELDESFRAELADVLSHVLLMARHHGIDLAAEVERKWLVWHTTDQAEPAAPRGSSWSGAAPGRVAAGEGEQAVQR